MIKWKMLSPAFCFPATRELPLVQNVSFGCFNYVSSCLFIACNGHPTHLLFFSGARGTQIILWLIQLRSSCLFIERNAQPHPLFVFSGARWQVGDGLSATVARAAEKQKGGSWGRVVL
jgi:hypothetical protein